MTILLLNLSKNTYILTSLLVLPLFYSFEGEMKGNSVVYLTLEF